MPIPQNKDALKEAILLNWQKLRTELEGIPPELTRKQQLEGHAKGTRMSVCDLLAYLVGWGELVLAWNRKTEQKKTVDFPETGYQWNGLGLLAQKFYKDHEGDSFASLLKHCDKTVKDLLELVDSKTNRQLYGASWYRQYPLGRMIQLNSVAPYTNARLRLRKWKKESRLL